MKALIIDVSFFIGESVKTELKDIYGGECDCDFLYCLPDDTANFEIYDILVIDNDGIGNSKFKNGIAFLKEYEFDYKRQCVIHYSGLKPNDEDMKVFTDKRIVFASKGDSNPILKAIESWNGLVADSHILRISPHLEYDGSQFRIFGFDTGAGTSSNLRTMQKAVGGYIERLPDDYLPEKLRKYDFYVDEEGLLKPFRVMNRTVSCISTHNIYGPCIVTKHNDEDDTIGLTRAECDEIIEMISNRIYGVEVED